MALVTSDRAARAFAVMAVVEAVTWAGLLVGMLLKHVTETTELGVWFFGRAHGAAFILYVAATAIAAVRLRWSWWVTGVALAAAVPPLVTVPVERWLSRRGLLDAAVARAATPSAAST